MVVMDQKSKSSDLIRALYKDSQEKGILRHLPNNPPFIFYDEFKIFIMKRYGADGHTIRSYRDKLLAFKFIQIDHVERVFFTFMESPEYKPAEPITKFFSD